MKFSPGCNCCGHPICFNVTTCGNVYAGATVVVKDSGGTTVASGTTVTGTGQYCTPNLMGTGYTWTVTKPAGSSGIVVAQTGTANPGDTVNVGFLCNFQPPNTPSTATLTDSLFGTCTLTYNGTVPGPFNGLAQFNGIINATLTGIPGASCGLGFSSDPRTTISCPITYTLSCSDGVAFLQITYPACSASGGSTQYWAPSDTFQAPYNSSNNCLTGAYPSSIASDTCTGLNMTYTIPAGPTSSRGCGTPNASYVDTKDIYASGATINVRF